jgi:hypothetical protein
MTTTQTRKNIGTFGTTQMHEFRVTGCVYQWHAGHKSGECWTAFLRYNRAPNDSMTIDELYDWLDKNVWGDR